MLLEFFIACNIRYVFLSFDSIKTIIIKTIIIIIIIIIIIHKRYLYWKIPVLRDNGTEKILIYFIRSILPNEWYFNTVFFDKSAWDLKL